MLTYIILFTVKIKWQQCIVSCIFHFKTIKYGSKVRTFIAAFFLRCFYQKIIAEDSAVSNRRHLIDVSILQTIQCMLYMLYNKFRVLLTC
jgi:hypothetical protein